MLEEQHEGIGLIPATRTHSNSSSQNGQHTSASSTASLTSSLGSSLASSLGSTGSGTGGKVTDFDFLETQVMMNDLTWKSSATS
jgi:hypothetical protein